MTLPPDLFAEMHALTEAFTGFRRDIAAGQFVDMRGVDDRVKLFCAAVEEAEPQTRKALLPGFTTLLVLLEQLESELRAARDSANNKS